MSQLFALPIREEPSFETLVHRYDLIFNLIRKRLLESLQFLTQFARPMPEEFATSLQLAINEKNPEEFPPRLMESTISVKVLSGDIEALMERYGVILAPNHSRN